MDLQNVNPLFDARNIELLEILTGDPRIAMSELARRVGMSPPAVKERVARLEEAGIISGYRLEINPAAVGLPVTVFVRVKPAPGQLSRVAELAKRIPEVVECHRVTGEDCFIMKLHIEGIDTMDRILDQFLAHGQTTTSIVQSTPVPPRAVPLPDAGSNDRRLDDN